MLFSTQALRAAGPIQNIFAEPHQDEQQQRGTQQCHHLQQLQCVHDLKPIGLRSSQEWGLSSSYTPIAILYLQLLGLKENSGQAGELTTEQGAGCER